MVTRKEVAKVVAQAGISLAKATMLVDIAAAELELPAGPFSQRVAGEVEAIAARKAAAARK